MGREEIEAYLHKLEEIGNRLINNTPTETDIKFYLTTLSAFVNSILNNTTEIRQIKGNKYLQLQEKIYVLANIKETPLYQTLDSLIIRHKEKIFPIIQANSSISGLLIDTYS
jgi:uncharacterized protein YaaR (DUF327 family)